MRLVKSKMGVLLTVLLFSCTFTNVSAVKADTYGDRADFERICGENRIITSKEASNYQKSGVLVVAPAYSFEDQISAMNLVNKFNAKFMLTDGSETGYEDDLSIKKVYIVGGYSENDTFIVWQFQRSFNQNIEVIRVGGENIYETNLETLKIAGYKDVGVASSKIYADALSSYSLLRENGLGIMLVDGKSSYNNHGYNIKYTFGGKNTIKQDGGERISGNDRYSTSINIAKKTKYSNLAFVSGENYADAMSAINITNAKNADILLTPKSLNNETVSLSKNAKEKFAVGGPKSLTGKDVSIAIDGLDNEYYGPALREELNNKNKPKPKPQPKPQPKYVNVNHKSGMFRLEIPVKYMDRLVVKEQYNSWSNSTEIAIYSKYHYKYNPDLEVYEGGIAFFDLVNSSEKSNIGQLMLGTIKKGNVVKKVGYFFPTDYPSSDESQASKKVMQDNLRIVYEIVNKNVKAINGATFRQTEYIR